MNCPVVVRIFVLACAMLMGGCASDAYLRSAQGLASSGAKFAVSADQVFSGMRSSLDTHLAGEEMLAALKPNQYSRPTASEVESITKLQAALDARAAVMRQLTQTYSAFNALASYDASGEAETAIGGLTGAINSYSAVWKQPGIPAGTSTIIEAAAGAILAQAQVSRVKQASALIRTRLETFGAVLTVEAAAYKDVKEVVTRSAMRTTLALYELGIGSPHPILAELIATPGFEYRLDERQFKDIKVEERLKLNRGITLVAERRLARQIATEQAVIDDTQTGIAALIVEHKKLESGQAIDLATVSAMIVKFRTIVDRLNTARAGASGS